MWRRNDFRKLRRMSWRKRLLLVEAGLCLSAGRISIALFRFEQIARFLGLAEAGVEVNRDSTYEAATDLGWAVATIARRAPFHATCLVQTITGAAMMRRRRLPCSLSLGIAKESKGFAAHAWLRSGDRYVTGAPQHSRFTAISTFASPVARRLG